MVFASNISATCVCSVNFGRVTSSFFIVGRFSPALAPDSLSFSDYFKLNFYPEEILNYFGYSFEMKLLTFVKSGCNLVEVDALEKKTKQEFTLYHF